MNRNGNGGGGGGSQGGGDSNNSNYGYGYGVNHAQGGREEITFLVPASKCGVSFISDSFAFLLSYFSLLPLHRLLLDVAARRSN